MEKVYTNESLSRKNYLLRIKILGVTNNTKDNAFALKENTIGYSTWASINGKNVYARLLIRRKK